DVAKVILFCGVTVGLGMITLGGLALLFRPDLAAKMLSISPTLARGFGALCLMLPALYLLGCVFLRREVKIKGWTLSMPPLTFGVGQIGIGSANFACVAGCLHQVLSAAGEVPYLAVAAAYVIANTGALITHAPGGIGVVESVVMFLLPGAGVIGALV